MQSISIAFVIAYVICSLLLIVRQHNFIRALIASNTKLRCGLEECEVQLDRLVVMAKDLKNKYDAKPPAVQPKRKPERPRKTA